MTVYFVSVNPGPAVVRAGSNDIRIIGVELMDTKGYPYRGFLYVHNGGTLTGGSAATPTTSSPGAPASTATACSGTGADVSGGTNRFIGSYIVASSVGGGDVPSGTTFAGTSAWQPLADIVLPSGSCFRVSGTPFIAVIWFEELRLSWSM